ncbi:arginine N-methyltransferase [Achlya hypogyna]|uniref:Protein arginine N-methyltransferase n=1 Tax=Achlya hypogyna TaxID=1202772 RepID=A0A1V9YFS1_ACHHY|nr:arginine N-methyltransferase [Achlya hypogyna]
MYNGADKYSGAVVGEDFKAEDAAAPNLEDILDTASAEETIVTSMPYSYEDDGEVIEGVSTVVLASRLNPESGGLMWVEEEDAAETYKNVVAMSQMTSMLRDTDRNAAYEHGIQHGIAAFIARHGRAPVVLDIGTGTGLLAMLAAKHGAAHVYACEMFETMADIATHVTAANGFADRITVLPKRSTDLRIPEDIPARADMLVSELFDSLLLGEGILPTLHHARTHLLVETDPVIVPRLATVHAKLVQSEALFRMNSLAGVAVADGVRLARNDAAWACTGGRVALPLHTTNAHLAPVDLSAPVDVLQLDFAAPLAATAVVDSTTPVVVAAAGSLDAVLMWWTVDFGGGRTYCTAPGAQKWQDHWVPVAFPLATQRQVAAGDELSLVTLHDSLRVWFQVHQPVPLPKKLKVDHDVPPCVCGMHLICNAERISMLASTERTTAYRAAIAAAGAGATNALDVSDGSLGAMLAATAVDAVTSIESKEVSARIFSQLLEGNGLGDKVSVLCSGVKGLLPDHLHKAAPVDLVVGEPFYYAMQNLPIWQALNFWYRRTAVQHLLAANARFVPHSGRVMAMGVAFEHLHECFGQVQSVSGFDHAYFDALQGGYLRRDFPFPTYMYPYTPVTAPFEVLPLRFSETIAPFERRWTEPITDKSIAMNAVILWVEYALDAAATIVVATGPSQVDAKQAVRFLPVVESSPSSVLDCAVAFHASEGVLEYTFAVDEP